MRITGIFHTLLLFSLFFTSGCSTVIEGKSQKITVSTEPSGATCVLRRNDDVIGTVTSTPGSVYVDKNHNDLMVECVKEGYVSSKKRNRSDPAITGLGNIVMGQWSFVGNAIDSATGANNKYDSRIFIALDRATIVAQAPPPVQAASQAAAVAQPVPTAVIPVQVAQLPPPQPSLSSSSIPFPSPPHQAVELHTQQVAGELVRQAALISSQPSLQPAAQARMQQLAAELVQDIQRPPFSAIQ